MCRRRAFSVIELIVVCAIVAVLVGMLIPAVQQVRLLSDRARCKSNLHQLGLSMEMYRDTFKVYPDAAQLPGLPVGKPMIQDALGSFVEPDTAVFRCPCDPSFFESVGTSYEYPALDFLIFPGLANKRLEDLTRAHRGTGSIRCLYDYLPTHGQPGTLHKRNFLYLDGHVDTHDPTLFAS